jgi:hypothetical protein
MMDFQDFVKTVRWLVILLPVHPQNTPDHPPTIKAFSDSSEEGA